MIKVWVNGCFDILHSGHIEMLEYAKSLGDYLIVGLDSDERVNKLKGGNRPIIPLTDRKIIINALECVDNVVSFNSNDELKLLIKNNLICVMVVGEEYKNKNVIGDDLVKKVEFFKLKKGKSTTGIINKILNVYMNEHI